jgi:dipeptidyl aminopeptidase/acylaminoacyl peptidase
LKSGARIAAVVNFYGVTDLTRLLDRPAITRLLPGQDLEPAARRLSPVSFVHRGMPPVLSIHGTADQLIPLEQTALLTRSIRDAGGEASETFIEGAGHGFSAKEQDTAYDAVFRFLALRGIIRPFPAQPGR